MEIISEIGQLILLLLLSATKFLFAPSAFFAAGYSLISTIILNFLGGFAGSVFFLKLGKNLFSWWYTKFPNRNKRKFTKTNRSIIRVKNGLGLIGIAAFLPIISVPISAFIAAKYFPINRTSFLVFGLICAFWSVIISLFSEQIVAFVGSLI